MRKRPIHRKVNFKNALFKVLRKIDPAGTISSKAMDVLNDMICDVMERIASEAATIRAKDKKATLMARDIQTAIRLVLPGAVFTHAFYEAHRALRSFVQWREPADA
jgi:histone H2B